MARKSTMVTSIDEIVGWNKMADGRILSNEEFDGENGHPVYLCPETESFSVYYLTIAWKKCEQPN